MVESHIPPIAGLKNLNFTPPQITCGFSIYIWPSEHTQQQPFSSITTFATLGMVDVDGYNV